MIEVLAFATTVVCGLLALGVLLTAAAGRYRWRAVRPALAGVELAVLAQAVADVCGQLAGHRMAEQLTHNAYLATSLLVLPVTATQIARDNGRWAGLLLAAALIALAVVVVRMQTTWRVGGG
ncbi:hypothetical protein GCM10010174_18890 [Kutzneria viridogrisea]|uniref:Integral membrane protein n=1 Tax=Kutzneria viridogrisea TaxID=47990 RepID=A0ABR6B7R6_9PSEU|nr:hypothetical protein [Kutzneria viridogrisea]